MGFLADASGRAKWASVSSRAILFTAPAGFDGIRGGGVPAEDGRSAADVRGRVPPAGAADARRSRGADCGTI